MAAKASRILVTGGNTGIGYEVAKQLLQRGHEVVIACRDSTRAQNAVSRLQQASKSSKVDSVNCDLSSFASVRACAAEVNSKWPQLDVLVCNAAVITQQPTLTPDGFNTMYQVNHLSQVLLTHLLLPNLLKSEAGRIVVVGSQLHRRVSEALADPLLFHKLQQQQQQQQQGTATQQQQQQQQQQQKDTANHQQQQAEGKADVPSAMQLYSVTKLYNLWFVRHFAAAVLPQLTGGSSSSSGSSGKLVINAVSPGFVPTSDLGRHLWGVLGRFAMKYIVAWAPFAVSLPEAGSRVAALCDGAAEGSTSGASYSKRVVEDVSGTPSADAEKAAVLWQQSMKDLGISDFSNAQG